jgi:hypothetical protein
VFAPPVSAHACINEFVVSPVGIMFIRSHFKCTRAPYARDTCSYLH